MKKYLKAFYIFDAAVIAMLVVFAALTYRETIDIDDAREDARKTSFVELSDGLTEYEIAGPPDGPPVVLIHGLSVDIYDWDFQFDFLADRGFRVLRYAQFGRGLSDRPAVIYDRDFYMKQLDEIINHFFDEPVHLIGHSFGGALSVDYASRFPESTGKVLLLSPALNLSEDNGGVALIRIPIIGDYAALTILSPILASRAEGLFETAEQNVTETYNDLFDRQTRIKGFSQSVKSLFRNNAVEDFSDAYESVEGSNVLLLWGELDNSIPPEHISKIESLNNEISIIRLEGANHSPNLEIPDVINKQILGFFQSSLDREGT